MIIAKHGRTQVGSLILGGMLLLGLAATAAANPMHDGPEGGKSGAPAMAHDRDFARSLDLTAQQRETLQADRLARGKRLIQLQADKKILRLELEALVEQDAPDMGKIESLAGKIGDVQTKLIV
ncbi:MAG: periplasmic heavy metal sensor, partial [Candidatus Firestonebacteria bacterium]|nr:periplasmic heavy metal sensor [Candidatus Firestonebacteria bacterium]